jgi:hypothetical protein
MDYDHNDSDSDGEMRAEKLLCALCLGEIVVCKDNDPNPDTKMCGILLEHIGLEEEELETSFEEWFYPSLESSKKVSKRLVITKEGVLYRYGLMHVGLYGTWHFMCVAPKKEHTYFLKHNEHTIISDDKPIPIHSECGERLKCAVSNKGCMPEKLYRLLNKRFQAQTKEVVGLSLFLQTNPPLPDFVTLQRKLEALEEENQLARIAAQTKRLEIGYLDKIIEEDGHFVKYFSDDEDDSEWMCGHH